jgi:FkbM family methyltransferase
MGSELFEMRYDELKSVAGYSTLDIWHILRSILNSEQPHGAGYQNTRDMCRVLLDLAIDLEKCTSNCAPPSAAPREWSQANSVVFPATTTISFPFGLTAQRVTPSIIEPWWRDVFPSWDPGTFATLHRLVGPDTTVIDVGAWIGPTVLFAAHLAKRVVALECDPHAAFELSQNVARNPRLSHRISITSLCASDRPERLGMAGCGLSGSVLNRVSESHFLHTLLHTRVAEASRRVQTVWEVDCLSLEQLVADARLGPGPLFVKLDVEGAESFIVPGLAAWVARSAGPHRPAFLISLHHAFSRLHEDPPLLGRWLAFLALFRDARLVGGPPRPGVSWTAQDLAECAACDLVVCDWDACLT